MIPPGDKPPVLCMVHSMLACCALHLQQNISRVVKAVSIHRFPDQTQAGVAREVMAVSLGPPQHWTQHPMHARQKGACCNGWTIRIPITTPQGASKPCSSVCCATSYQNSLQCMRAFIVASSRIPFHPYPSKGCPVSSTSVPGMPWQSPCLHASHSASQCRHCKSWR